MPSLSGDTWQAFRRGDTLTALVLVGLILLSWLAKKYLETEQKGVGIPVYELVSEVVPKALTPFVQNDIRCQQRL